jgi:hypothetical protein
MVYFGNVFLILILILFIEAQMINNYIKNLNYKKKAVRTIKKIKPLDSYEEIILKRCNY